ncbi:MAG: hypothetical protein Tsb009_01220 [Planctomycetaceae bacterium]
MNTQAKAIEDYRNQIRRCAQSLAVANTKVVTHYLPKTEKLEMVDVYAEGNLDKRIWKLGDQFEFMKEEFDQLDEWIQTYIHTVPLAAYDTGSTDSVLFLDWLEKHMTLTPEQQDYVTCHRSRIEVEEIARENRMGHVRFQEILSATKEVAEELSSNRSTWIHLNPIRVWARFETNILTGEDESGPTTVVFFPVGNEIRTTILEPIAQIVLDELESQPSCRMSELTGTFPPEQREAVVDICRDLAELGLVAFG